MARVYFTCETKTSLLSHKQIANVLGGYCGCPKTDDEVEGLQHWCKNAPGHGPKEESRSRKGTNKSKYSIVF